MIAAVLVPLTALSPAPSPTFAASDADPTWNGGSPAFVTPPTEVHPVAQVVTADGGVDAVGFDFAPGLVGPVVVRFTSAGTVDGSFGNSGIVHILPLNSFASDTIMNASDAALQPTSGKLLVVGLRNSGGWAVARVNANGSPDPTFGGGTGQAYASDNAFGTFDGFQMSGSPRLKVLADGSMLLAEFVRDAGGTFDIAVVKLDAAGAHVNAFGSNGIAVTEIPGAMANTTGTMGGIAVDALGRIVVTGTAPTQAAQTLIARWMGDGKPDPAFGTNGLVLDPQTPDVCGGDVAIDSTNRIDVTCGGGLSNSRRPLASARRYAASDGSVDTSFGVDGTASVPAAPLSSGARGSARATRIAVDGDKVVIAGQISDEDYFLPNDSATDAAVWRFTAGGQVDRSFGASGGIVRDDLRLIDVVAALTISSGGKVSMLAEGSGGLGAPTLELFRNVPATVVAEPSFNPTSAPERLLDTRIGAGAPIGKVQAGTVLPVHVTGVAGVPDSAVAVALNVTATEPQSAGYLTVYPCGQVPPVASNLNVEADETIPNLVISRIGTGGNVCIVGNVTTHVLADITGWYGAKSDLHPLAAPSRKIDTRIGLGGPVGKIGGATVAKLAQTGELASLDKLDEVVLNVTVTDPVAAGFITVYDCGQPRPLASNLNYTKGQTIPNLVVTRMHQFVAGQGFVDSQRLNAGQVCFYASTPTDLIVDLEATLDVGSAQRPLAVPARLLDTRVPVGAPAGPLAAGSVLRLHVAGVAGVATDAPAVVLNVTVTDPSSPGYVTVFPCGQAPPVASNLNFVADETIPNLVIARVGAGGDVCFVSNASLQLVADLAEWYPSVS